MLITKGFPIITSKTKQTNNLFFIDRSSRLFFMANFVLWTLLNYLVVPFGLMDGFVICAIFFFFKDLDFGLLDFNEKLH